MGSIFHYEFYLLLLLFLNHQILKECHVFHMHLNHIILTYRDIIFMFQIRLGLSDYI